MWLSDGSTHTHTWRSNITSVGAEGVCAHTFRRCPYVCVCVVSTGIQVQFELIIRTMARVPGGGAKDVGGGYLDIRERFVNTF